MHVSLAGPREGSRQCKPAQEETEASPPLSHRELDKDDSGLLGHRWSLKSVTVSGHLLPTCW